MVGTTPSYNFFYTPSQNAGIVQAQQQQALAQALIAQGASPLDVSNRQVGGVGYSVSPLEGLAKLAQGLTGQYAQKSANQGLVDALTGKTSADPSASDASSSAPQTSQSTVMSAISQMPPLVQMQFMQNQQYGEAGARANAEILTGFLKPTDKQKEDMVDGNYQPPSPAPQPQPQISGAAPSPNAVANAASSTAQPISLGDAPPPGVPPVPPTSGGIQLNAPAPPEGNIPTSPPFVSAPKQPWESTTAYHNRIEVEKANAIARGAIQPAGDKKLAEDTGTNAAEAMKTLKVMATNLPVLQQRINTIKDASKDSSLGPWNDEKGTGFASRIADYQNGPASIANAKIQQLTAQGILPELGPQLAQAGSSMKGNKFIEQLASESSGIDLSKGRAAREAQADGLITNYAAMLKAQIQKVKEYGGDASVIFPDPQSVVNAVKLGVLSKDEAVPILQQKHGFQ